MKKKNLVYVLAITLFIVLSCGKKDTTTESAPRRGIGSEKFNFTPQLPTRLTCGIVGDGCSNINPSEMCCPGIMCGTSGICVAMPTPTPTPTPNPHPCLPLGAGCTADWQCKSHFCNSTRVCGAAIGGNDPTCP